ncbi:MAG: membrane dipeptidase [Planctomycetota bacterium]|nr:membrane dipeptidase [Planctomycetota bacterium]
MYRRNFIKAIAAGTLSGNAASAGTGPPAANGTAQLTERLNPQMQQARDAALDILQPSPRDLEHGLQLHHDALVFDAYGFSPRSAVDGAALARAFEAGASPAEMGDLREEMSMTRYALDPIEQQEYRDAWRASGVTCIFQNAGQEGQDPLRLLKRLARFTFATDMLRGFVSKAAIPADILDVKKRGNHCLYLTGNGVPLRQQWISIPDELQYVRIFFQLGIRMMHLTYQRRNMIGDGCAETANAGLSDFGRHAIAEMNRIGVIPDCAHSGWQTSLEAAQVSDKPVVASHTTCAHLHPHIRSKPDPVMRAIAESGGYLGICCISRFLRGTGDIRALLDHIDYAVKKVGPDHVAIGTDVAYTSQNAAGEQKKIPRGAQQRTAFRSLWPRDDFPVTERARTSIAWTNWPLFTVGLVQRGYPDNVIRKIIGGNVLRVTRASLPQGS